MGEVVVPRNFRVSRRRPSPRARARGGPSLRWRKRRALWISRGRDSPRLRSQLLEELEKFEKGQNGDMNCSAGAPPVSRSEAAVAPGGQSRYLWTDAFGVLNFVSIFVVLGVGADDTFVLWSLWKHSKPCLSIGSISEGIGLFPEAPDHF